jgi:Flp pilus assembly protein TadD
LVRDDPNADIAANNLAALLSEHRNDEKSLAKAHELARRFERSKIPQFANTLGWANHRVGRYSEAEYYLRDAVSRMPNMAIFRYHLGMNYLALQDKEAARRELEKAVELAPVSPFGQLEHAREKLASL